MFPGRLACVPSGAPFVPLLFKIPFMEQGTFPAVSWPTIPLLCIAGVKRELRLTSKQGRFSEQP